jgi:hypothetical protein
MSLSPLLEGERRLFDALAQASGFVSHAGQTSFGGAGRLALTVIATNVHVLDP